MRAIFGAADLVEGLGGGEEGSWGVKGEGGIARLEERKGVDVTVRVERISLEKWRDLFVSVAWFFFKVPLWKDAVVDESLFRLPFGKDRTVCKCNEC